jgi:hypothetical protein
MFASLFSYFGTVQSCFHSAWELFSENGDMIPKASVASVLLSAS